MTDVSSGIKTRPSASKKPQATFGTVNFDYIQEHGLTFHRPNASTRIRNAAGRS
jgi:hypothetical protein